MQLAIQNRYLKMTMKHEQIIELYNAGHTIVLFSQNKTYSFKKGVNALCKNVLINAKGGRVI